MYIQKLFKKNMNILLVRLCNLLLERKKIFKDQSIEFYIDTGTIFNYLDFNIEI